LWLFLIFPFFVFIFSELSFPFLCSYFLSAYISSRLFSCFIFIFFCFAIFLSILNFLMSFLPLYPCRFIFSLTLLANSSLPSFLLSSFEMFVAYKYALIRSFVCFDL
jgi:hypothetical protein